ncbi:MAG: DUF2007 domain-containing protein [Geoalkalibacter sp.]|jgi:hypothetical protein|uniref:putative signal transducing protein n=1 Tax=Geoalkalibacter sp. TaxID=3041440 RepID=UPI002A9283B2|nr:DUF2007 domain-containing protein [Thermodesulfobacteriota bacterium]
MKRLHVFSLQERPLAQLLKERLRYEGVDCLLRNEELFSALGEIPFLECRPELWIIDEEVLPRARKLVEGWLREDQNHEAWICSTCGEKLEGQFDSCWKCGQERGEKA